MAKLRKRGRRERQLGAMKRLEISPDTCLPYDENKITRIERELHKLRNSLGIKNGDAGG